MKKLIAGVQVALLLSAIALIGMSVAPQEAIAQTRECEEGASGCYVIIKPGPNEYYFDAAEQLE